MSDMNLVAVIMSGLTPVSSFLYFGMVVGFSKCSLLTKLTCSNLRLWLIMSKPAEELEVTSP